MFSVSGCSPIGDEDLGAGDAVGAVALRHGAGLQEAQVRARMRLGELHGAGPLAGDHFRQIFGLQRLASLFRQRLDAGLGQQRIEPEGHIRAVPHFLTAIATSDRQALAAMLGGHGSAFQPPSPEFG